jgi:hypothetical protein
MFKSLLIFILLPTILMSGCDVNPTPGSDEAIVAHKPYTEITQPEQSREINDPIFVPPLHIGKKLDQISPYVMSTYGFHKVFGASSFQVSIHTANYEDMVESNEKKIVAVLFISQGDLHEAPLSFYIHADLEPGFVSGLNFCAIPSENEITVYARLDCDTSNVPKEGSISIQWDPWKENAINIDGIRYFLNTSGSEYPVSDENMKMLNYTLGNYICTMSENAGIASSHMEGSGPPKSFSESGLTWKFMLRVDRDEINKSQYRMIELPYSGPDREIRDWHSSNSILHSPYFGDGYRFTAGQDQGFIHFFNTMKERKGGNMEIYHAGEAWAGGEDHVLLARWGRCKLLN